MKLKWRILLFLSGIAVVPVTVVLGILVGNFIGAMGWLMVVLGLVLGIKMATAAVKAGGPQPKSKPNNHLSRSRSADDR